MKQSTENSFKGWILNSSTGLKQGKLLETLNE